MIYDIQVALERIDGSIKAEKREVASVDEHASCTYLAYLEGRIAGMMLARNEIKNALKSARKREDERHE